MTSSAPGWTALAEPLQAAATGLATLADRALAGLGVTAAQWKVLEALDRAGGARVGELVEALHHDQAAVSRLAGRLEAAGLVRRLAVAGDARGARLLLTTRGLLATRACRRRLEGLARRVLGPFSGPERAGLEALLQRLQGFAQGSLRRPRTLKSRARAATQLAKAPGGREPSTGKRGSTPSSPGR